MAEGPFFFFSLVLVVDELRTHAQFFSTQFVSCPPIPGIPETAMSDAIPVGDWQPIATGRTRCLRSLHGAARHLPTRLLDSGPVLWPFFSDSPRKQVLSHSPSPLRPICD